MQQVRAQIEGRVGVIALDNLPDQFMTSRMVAELDELTAQWEVDENVRSIVITGTGTDTFITHFSVEELAKSVRAVPRRGVPPLVHTLIDNVVRGMEASERALVALPSLRRVLERASPAGLRPLFHLNQIHRVFSRLERMDKAIVAAINGTAMGGGCELALACDYRLMARGDHVIGLVEVLGGIVPGAGGTQRLVSAVGRAKAIEMILDGQVVSPDEAERIGLVTRVVDAHKLLDEAMATARRLATRAPAAVGNAKRAVRVGSTLPIDDGLAFEKLGFIACGLHPDARKLGEHYVERFRAGARARRIFDDLRSHGMEGDEGAQAPSP
jgi:enoyl-CoA hydratase/carnithine racemase